MFYSVRHITRFRYSVPITESIMKVHMQPRSEGVQRCHQFSLTTDPRSRVMAHRDHLSNVVHQFDIPRKHTHLTITAEALVEVDALAPLPDKLTSESWSALDELVAKHDYWEMLTPSRFARPSIMLLQLAQELNVSERRDDPLQMVREINTAIPRVFAYVPRSTSVHSPIDEALEKRQGVCQDFAHITLALLRNLRIPCRYISGYLFHRTEDEDRTAQDATHAWIEALLPDLGWVGFDPTNDIVTGDRHIRAGIGRDYDDVPPTRGVFKGKADSELEVSVQVSPTDAPLPEDDLPPLVEWIPSPYDEEDSTPQQQQQ